MATQTPNLNLVLPDYSDKADVSVLNENFEKIDSFSGGGKVEEWLEDIRVKADESLKEIQTKATESLNEIENKANNTLASIPDDYETIYNDVKSLKDQIPAKKTYAKTYEWVSGGISNSGGINLEATNRCRGQYKYYADATLRITPKDGYKFNVFRFGAASQPETYIGSLGGLVNTEQFVECDNKYIRFVVAKTDDSVLLPEDVPVDVITIDVISIGENMPDYYAGHMEGKTGKVLEDMNSVGVDGETFVFITDIHWTTGNAKKSPCLVRELIEKTNLNTLICGGDLIDQGEKVTEMHRILDCVKAFSFSGIPFVTAFGNHDDNSNNQEDMPDRWFNRNEVFANQMKPASNVVHYLTDVDWSFTYDRPATKTRFFVIDTGTTGTIDESARRLVYDALKDTPEGYGLVVVGHWLYNATNAAFTTYGAELVSVLDAFNAKSAVTISGVEYDFAESKGKVSCILIGHSHADAQGVTSGGIPWMMTDTDNYARSKNKTREVGTVTEQCFDIVTVNNKTGGIRTVRIGAGGDRVYSDGNWA